ncbi:MAG: glycosyltransferase [Deltaproteobacteria bacterium]|nr:glycosyltransferase [Deltaproteobacteria bacterium]
MKILFVTPYLCYPEVPYAGGLTIFELMKGLSFRGHEVFLITGLRPGDRDHLGEVKPLCQILDAIEVPWTKNEIMRAVGRWMLNGLKDGLTFRRKAAFSVTRFSTEIPFDIIQVEHTELGECMKRPDGIPMVIDAHDILLKPSLREYKLAKGISKLIKYIKYKALERREISIYKRFDRVFTRSEFDREMLLSYDRELDVSILPPYVRIEYPSGNEIRRDTNSILFTGAMDRPVNIEAVRYFYKEIFPLIKKEIPDARFYVVGNKPPEEIKRIGEKDKDVIITNFVKDIKPYYLRASVFAAPLFVGGGIIVKILDAMAAGLPVVTTTVGNEGIEAIPDRDIVIADEPEDFANKAVILLRDESLWKRFSENGGAFARKKFAWDGIVENMVDEYKRLIA